MTLMEQWTSAHPGVNLTQWVTMLAALDSLHDDWAFAQSPIKMSPVYDGAYGYWID